MRIVRFLTFESALRVLSAHSTFAMQSVQYYVHLGFEQRDGGIGDTRENQAVFEESRRHYELLAATLISCWTILENDQILAPDWEIFDDRQNGVAIVSDIESVRSLLRELAKGFLTLDKEGVQSKNSGGRYLWDFEDGKVNYYDLQHPEEFDTMKTWLWKRAIYKNQREYRFAFLTGSPMRKVDSIIFHVRDPRRYIQEIHFGPKVNEADKEKLRAGAIAAELLGKIRNEVRDDDK